jgi:peptidoglycan/xylan/chitin deacetylase (PgdA/CDA1 family)
VNRRQLLARAAAVAGAAALLDACGSSSAHPPSTAGATPAATTPPPAAADSSASPTAAPASAATTSPVPTPAPGGWSPGQSATYVNHGDAAGQLVALTFHFAGDAKRATRLLDALQAAGVKSTLFAVGDWITAHPDLGHRAVADGHELGNHTKSHLSMLTLGRTQVHDEIDGGAQALVPFLGSIGRWFRPSGTDLPNQVILDEAGRVGYPVSVGYDVDPKDYTEPGAPKIVDAVRAALHPGAIVSLHFGHTGTIDALPALLTSVQSAGLQTATVSQLLSP